MSDHLDGQETRVVDVRKVKTFCGVEVNLEALTKWGLPILKGVAASVITVIIIVGAIVWGVYYWSLQDALAHAVGAITPQELEARLAKFAASAPVGGLPPRAVIAFDDPGACSNLGDGWKDAELEGRFIVGADNKLDGKWSYRSHQETDSIQLRPENLPRLYYLIEHRQEAKGSGVEFHFIKSVKTTRVRKDDATVAQQEADENKEDPIAIKVIPPYMALHFCKKK
jgi:hypothetical protein